MDEIEKQRAEMHRLAEIYGLGHPLVIEQSQRLDELIVRAQRGMN